MLDEMHKQDIQRKSHDAALGFHVVDNMRKLTEILPTLDVGSRDPERFLPVIVGELGNCTHLWGARTPRGPVGAIGAGKVCAVLHLGGYPDGALDDWLGYKHECPFHKAADADQ